MLKRRISICLFVIGALAVFAVMTKLSLRDSGAASVRTVEDMKQIPFIFYGVYDEGSRLIYDEAGSLMWEKICKEAADADIVLVVRPTERARLYGYAVLQETEILHTIKSDEMLPDKIWIERNNGFTYQPQLEEDTLRNWGMDNLMYPQWEYLVFLNKYDYAPDSYFNDFLLGAIRLSEEKNYECIDINNTYTYGQLIEQEFFAESVETLDSLYELKELLLSIYPTDG